jgi:hypothetical protein
MNQLKNGQLNLIELSQKKKFNKTSDKGLELRGERGKWVRKGGRGQK